ncbi:chromate efflux transporter [Anaerorhabdus sp.]|uniref:chromate efflux transporter n=1 Tax=Anaerorhabdus sp. TaxID=1872524 RepID=UPI002B210701|nr:chromate efflux transporter [Anaerorhabdus sp.]MEA4875165.1 chromate efflux transporter [Anaerorhabdus sp.]
MKPIQFLKDVFICSLGAFGGPEAHFSVFYTQLVNKKKYLSEEELIELNALCSILPGPTSTQTIAAIGYKIGGKLLAFLTLIVWALPIITFMTLLAILFPLLVENNVSLDFLKFVAPLAIAFVLFAAYKISKKVIKDQVTFLLALSTAVITFFFKVSWIYPVLLLAGGALAIFAYKEENMFQKVKLNVSWRYLILFVLFAIGSAFLVLFTQSILVNLFYQFYRFGYLVFGGGQVVVPLMIEQFVDINHYLTADEFLIGYGLIQGMPGPMFAFSSFVGGLAARNLGVITQAFAGIISGLAIFLPGILLIYFIYPIWHDLRQVKAIKIALKGINAVASGLLLSTAIALILQHVNSLTNLLVVLFSLGLLFYKKVPAPVIILITILLGFIL